MAKPTDNSEVFLNQLISQIQIHLQTVGGIYITNGTILPNPLPLPGFKSWTGYTIPPDDNSPSPDIIVTEEVLENLDKFVDFKPEELAVSNIASNKGYAIAEATGLGSVIGGEVIKGSIKLEQVADIIPEKERKSDTDSSDTDIKVQLSEKISECGDVKISAPNEALINAMKLYGILTPIQRAHFLAQVSHETANFRYKEEIASGQAYEGRKGLGNTQPGDGKRFKGRGYIQLTGRANYTNYNTVTADDVIQSPTEIVTKYYADVAGWFWKRNKINDLALDDTQNSVLKVSIRINGKNKNGLPNGWEDRKKKFCAYWKNLQENPNLYT